MPKTASTASLVSFVATIGRTSMNRRFKTTGQVCLNEAFRLFGDRRLDQLAGKGISDKRHLPISKMPDSVTSVRQSLDPSFDDFERHFWNLIETAAEAKAAVGIGIADTTSGDAKLNKGAEI